MSLDHLLIASMKDEGPFVVEWLAHHLAVGFDRVIVATNDCTDGTDRLLFALAAAGFAGHVPNVLRPGDVPHQAGYAAIRAAHPVDRARWLMVLDADELLNVHVGARGVADLTALAEGDADVIALHAMTFAGAEGSWAPGRVASRFRGRLALRHKANTLLKSLARDPSRFRAIHSHSMVGFNAGRPLRALWGDGSIREIPEEVPLWQALRSGAVGPRAHRLAQVNHYATKTRDAFALRRRRGRGAAQGEDQAARRYSDAYWADRAAAEAEDRSIDAHAEATVALMARMLAVPAVAEAQAACEAEWARRTREARQATGWRQEAE